MSAKSFGTWRRRWVKKIGGKLLWGLETTIAKASNIPTTPFLQREIFPWVDQLEGNWERIRDEAEGVLQNLAQIPNFQDISTDQTSITNDDQWKTFFLYGMGYKAESNCRHCPATTRLVEAVPGMRTAFFSILAPGKHIPAHRGLYKGFVRYHLGLIVPEPREACRIRVGTESAYWEPGKSIFFDDTYDHEVWNETDGTRVILFMDVLRPLRQPFDWLNRAALSVVKRSAYVQDAKRNQEIWDRKFADRLKEDVSAAEEHRSGIPA